MRELKFRAFHPQRRCFSDPKSFGLGQSSLFFHSQLSTLEVRPSNTELIIEQFTGIIDKNGREIYEGDILNVFTNLGTYPLAVKWIPDGYWGFDHPEPETYGYLSEWIGSEVIGNIHSNPELLAKK